MDGHGNESARNRTDLVSRYLFLGAGAAAVAVVLFIFVFIALNAQQAVTGIGIVDFLTGREWAPLSDRYGALPLIVGTVTVTIGAIVISVPLGLGSAVYISEVAPERWRGRLKMAAEAFAGIPSIVYGFFGLTVLVPFLRRTFPDHLIFGSSVLAGSIILGIMALPTIISVSEDALKAVPKTYREASYALGATKWETIRNVILPAAMPGISVAIIMGMGRAIGETMAVMMVTGNASIIPDPLWDMFSLVRTITASLALEIPESVHGSMHHSALFLLGLVLMLMILAVNASAKMVSKKVSEGSARGGVMRKVPKVLRRVPLAVAAFVGVAMIVSLFMGVPQALALGAVVAALTYATPFLTLFISRNLRNNIFMGVFTVAMVLTVGILVVIFAEIITKGLPALTPEFITGYPRNSGLDGGIFPAIVGTLKLIAGTAIIAFPLGIFAGVYMAEYAGVSKVTKTIRWATEILNGTPSVVFGLFGMAFFVIYLGMGFSLLAGCLTLAFLVLPVIIRTTEEAVRAVPDSLREASYALGATKWETVSKVVLPAAFGGVITGLILSTGRAAGETAPIMFTAVVVSQSVMPVSPMDPVMALPYHLYYLASEVPGAGANQYGTALVLLIIVLSLFAAASIARRRFAGHGG